MDEIFRLKSSCPASNVSEKNLNISLKKFFLMSHYTEKYCYCCHCTAIEYLYVFLSHFKKKRVEKIVNYRTYDCS